jgi:hypothetical protein
MDILCFFDPGSYTFFAPPYADVVLESVGNASKVQDFALQSWMTVCALGGKDAPLRCSAPPAVRVEVCAPVGRATHCGLARPIPERGNQEPQLLGVGTPLATIVKLPLQEIAGTKGVTAMQSFRNEAYQANVGSSGAGGRTVLSGDAPGGCGLNGQSLVCWERDPCAKKTEQAWKRYTVPSAPASSLQAGNGILKFALGASHGYLLTTSGALYTWPKAYAADDCSVRTASEPSHTLTRVALAGPVADVAGGLLGSRMLPGYHEADCASTQDGKLWCWTSDRAGFGKPAEVSLPARAPQ